MASPVADFYGCPSGGVIVAGRHRLPVWARGAALNTWTEIPNTIYGNGAMDSWGGLALKKSNSELIIVAPGGHSDSSYNGADSIVLSADTPAWTHRRNSSPATANVLYYADGTPTSRHLYHYIHYIESIDAVLLSGCRFGYGGGTPTGPGMDLFDLATNAYMPRYTYPDIPDTSFGVVQDGQGRIWTTSGKRFDPSTGSWTATTGWFHRFPVVYDSLRDTLFSIQYGDGQGVDSGLNSVKVDAATGTASVITINASAAYTDWLAAAPSYATLDYDPDNDRFLFYHGGETGKVYVITPNSGTAWDMSVLATTGTPSATPASGAGINKRFLYVPKLKGFVMVPKASSNIWYLRTK